MEIDYYVKKFIILGFLNTLMIESVFYNENLVLLKNIYEKYEVSLFDEHIPYKNILINNINVFFLLENIFKNTYLLNIFRVLLNSVGIYSLILDNFGKNKIQNKSFKFYIFTITIFKSKTISNFRNESFSAFFEELSRFVRKDLEYIRFINLFIPWDILGLFLKSQKLKGLMLSDTSMPMNNHFMDIISDLIKTLEYINFVHVDISFAWWTDFFESGNAHEIILDFYSIVSQNYFLKAFSDSYSFKDITYFEVLFCCFKISTSFCDSLVRFKSLKTLKISHCFVDSKNENWLLEAIDCMKNFESLSICQNGISNKLCNVIFRNPGIRFLQLESEYRAEYMDEEGFNFDFNDNYCSLKELVIKYIKISYFSLREIFKLKNLTNLHLESYEIDIPRRSESLFFAPRDINSLYIRFDSIEFINRLNILSNLVIVKQLGLFGPGLIPGNISNLCMLCNYKLKTIIFSKVNINMKDLNRIKKLGVLEKFVLCQTKFLDCSVCNLGDKCTFLYCLKSVIFESVVLNSTDIIYLCKFKKLEKLSLLLCRLNLDLFTFKMWLVSSSLKEICIGETNMFRFKEKQNVLDNTLQSYFKETNICFSR
ncbi:hypothetical protein CWI37_0692p0020 [Hamiltosporidium tvaerminnensis]|uniref:Uncharacterized protein n=1 Tax=Hamiltosporidium tvaerminnensis TaxID=1176355 RepID=A0A4Q9L316_9MICR|nr:hypothetical protein CWI37_0692p0020 [Hamiltosporidium tvaerminnensis]